MGIMENLSRGGEITDKILFDRKGFLIPVKDGFKILSEKDLYFKRKFNDFQNPDIFQKLRICFVPIVFVLDLQNILIKILMFF